jgi:hypothetical protein
MRHPLDGEIQPGDGHGSTFDQRSVTILAKVVMGASGAGGVTAAHGVSARVKRAPRAASRSVTIAKAAFPDGPCGVLRPTDPAPLLPPARGKPATPTEFPVRIDPHDRNSP